MLWDGRTLRSASRLISCGSDVDNLLVQHIAISFMIAQPDHGLAHRARNGCNSIGSTGVATAHTYSINDEIINSIARRPSENTHGQPTIGSDLAQPHGLSHSIRIGRQLDGSACRGLAFVLTDGILARPATPAYHTRFRYVDNRLVQPSGLAFVLKYGTHTSFSLTAYLMRFKYVHSLLVQLVPEHSCSGMDSHFVQPHGLSHAILMLTTSWFNISPYHS